MRSDTRLPGPRLIADRYRLTGYLGGGGMADVYRAYDLRLDRLVAVKMFRAGPDPSARTRFEKEARLLAALDHPGLVTLYDAGFADGEPYLVMKLVEGGTLAARLADGPLPVSEVLELGRQLTAILAYVHDCDVVHRDVKPSNVLISPNDRAFLADFGISRLLTARDRPTVAGKIMGTVGYLSPEQVRGDEVTQAVDVYALGLVLLECLTGRVEYEGTGVEAAVARLHRPPRVPADLAPPLSTVLQAMTATKAGNRPTMAECVTILDRDAPGPRKFRRSWVLAGSAVAGLAAVIAGSSILFSGDDRQNTQAPLSIDTGGPMGPPPVASDPPESPPPGHLPTLKRGQQDTIAPPPGPDRTITAASLPPASTAVSVTTTTVSDPPGNNDSSGNGKGKTKTHAPHG